ncbi:hypothetical protein NQ314_009137 [Rhamnusium bicolor]|uniref:Translocon-associated protein subunit delta n=1 Tax=Rhamnusium bicolor TaxID=1586634 RepID=A0AAV8Y2J3_9CUCU|nr:hypothetical protein NQ314_009137 [Rhamnusium bicolor]
MAQLLFLAMIFAVLSVGLCSSCSGFEVTSKSFTTQDATIVSNIAFISEFTVKCGSGELESLYVELDGNVSWTEESKLARTGDKVIRLFDEDGYTTYRKALRAGEDVSTVPALFSVVVNHPGAFNGPWLKSEFIATAISLVIAYFALASRAKVVS